MEIFPKRAFHLVIAAVFAAALAGSADVRRAQAHDWVGPAIVGALIGGAIVHNACRYDGCWHQPRRYHRRHAKYRHHYHRRGYYPAYPAIVIPLPFVAITPGW